MVKLAEFRLPVRVPGQREPRWTSLAERMGETQTSGVSVALIEGGELVSAEGFGVLEAGQPARVTPETIFQVCSISKHVTMLGRYGWSRRGGSTWMRTSTVG
jgi:CubicO group peptidase (beta-lactamase class C family)